MVIIDLQAHFQSIDHNTFFGFSPVFFPVSSISMKTAIVAGASGLAGAALMKQLVAHPDFVTIYSVSRRPLGIVSEKVAEIVIDFDGLPENLAGLTVDCAFCCLGTTLKTAGSKERQYVIDHDYVVHFAQACKAMNVPVFAVVSSIGAAAASRNFYLRTKARRSATAPC